MSDDDQETNTKGEEERDDDKMPGEVEDGDAEDKEAPDDDGDKDDSDEASPSSDSDDSDDSTTKKRRKLKSSKGEKSSKKRKLRRKDDDDDDEDDAPEDEKIQEGIKAFMEDDEEDDNDPALGPQAIESDGEEDEDKKEKSKGPGMGKKLGKKDKEILMQRERTEARKFVNALKEAAFDDMEAFKKGKMATHKTALLKKLQTELAIKRKHSMYLEEQILKTLKLWLDPLDEGKKNLPNRTLLKTVADILFDLPIDEEHRNVRIGNETKDYLDFVQDSEIGKSLMFIKKSLTQSNEKSSDVYKAVHKVMQKWYRLLFRKSGDYKQGDEDDGDEDVPKPKATVRVNRDWEKMPESVNSDGSKATKGDFGFRYGASVPRPMLVDFVRAPESKVDTEDLLERAKDSKNERKDRLTKIGIESRRSINDGRNTRAAQPELNRIHVGGVAAKVTSMGWAERASKSPKK